MTNKEKYELEADAVFAFVDECHNKHNRDCLNCPYRGVAGEDEFCMVRWLYSESEAETEADEDNNTTDATNTSASIDDTSEKLLSDRCREYCDVIGNSGNLKEKLDKKILEIIKLYDSHAYFIEDFYTIDQHDLLTIEYLTSRKSWVEEMCKDIPVKWLDFEIDEVKKIIESQKEEQKKKEDTNG
jgi:hypothetical protein